MVWFIGSVVTSYALFLMFTTLHWSPLLLVFGWAIVFDGPHVFGTLSRTYFDSENDAIAPDCCMDRSHFRSRSSMVILGLGIYFFFPGVDMGILPSGETTLWLHGSLQKRRTAI